MKKILLYSSIVMATLWGSCTKNFDDINTDPNRTSEEVLNPNFLLRQAQWDFSNTGYGQLLFHSMWIQSLASTYSYYGNGDKYVNSGSYLNYQATIFNEEFASASLIYEMQRIIKDKPEFVNLYNVGTLIKVLCIAKLTDTYGDVPYTQALQAKGGVSLPVYDKQEDIYPALLAEVEAATNALDPAAAIPAGDAFYAGDIAKWQRFGYSLMLRLGMRMTKVNAGLAQTWAEKAAAGGTFISIEDDAYVKGQNSTGYGNATTGALLVPDDFREVRWAKPFIDELKARNDPRLGVIGEVVPGGLVDNTNQELPGNPDAALQIGMPNGYDLAGTATDIKNAPGYPGATGTGADAFALGKYSRPRTSVYRDRSGINMVLSYAETELLLAEAKSRGWNIPGTADEHYQNGVSAAIQSIGHFNAIAAIPAATADAYAAAHPLGADALKDINTQLWLAYGTQFNFIESWANWRRSGYPELTPVVYPGIQFAEEIPRRIPYPVSEQTNNATNYKDAVSRLGGNNDFTSRVWWDVP